MILGLGMHMVEIDRIARSLERFGDRFLRRLLTPEERAALSPPAAHRVAARFAAKEAAVKALGTGFAGGIGMGHIAVLNTPLGAPEIFFTGPALARMRALGASRAHVTLTHSRDAAAAVVILEA